MAYAPIRTSDTDEVEMVGIGSNGAVQRVDTQIEMEGETKLDRLEGEMGLEPMDPHSRSHVIEESSLDDFFNKIYKYFYEKGFWNLFLSRFLKLITVLFVIVFSTFVLLFVNWKGLWECKEQECKTVPIIVFPSHLSTFGVWVIVFESVFTCYWLFLYFHYLFEIGEMIGTRKYFNKVLDISEQDIQTKTWPEILQKFSDIQNLGQISKVKQKLDEKDIVNLIMRKDNYLIAILNKKVLNLSLPWSKTPIVTESLLWNLRYYISWLFNKDGLIPDSVMKDKNLLRWRFIWLGILNLIAAPFIFVFILVYLFFKHTAELRDTGVLSIFHRRWTTFAKLRFREFNELPHVFEERMKKSIGPATNYLRQFPTYYLSIIGKIVMFLTSGFAAVIIAMTAIKSDLLINVNILNQNLLWWLSIFTIIYYNAKSVVIDDNFVVNPNAEMAQLCGHTHYYPSSWKGKGHHPSVRYAFCQLYQYTIVVMVYELLSIILTPLVLLFSLPNCAEQLCEFLNEATTKVEGLGHVCGFATFNLDKYGNQKYLFVTALDTSAAPAVAMEEGKRGTVVMEEGKRGEASYSSGEESHKKKKNTMDKQLSSSYGKMEQSLLNFALHHPKWQPDKTAREFVDHIKERLHQTQALPLQEEGYVSAQREQQLPEQLRQPHVNRSMLESVNKAFTLMDSLRSERKIM